MQTPLENLRDALDDNPNLQKDMLSGNRSRILREYNIPENLADEIMSIRANTYENFSNQLTSIARRYYSDSNIFRRNSNEVVRLLRDLQSDERLQNVLIGQTRKDLRTEYLQGYELSNFILADLADIKVNSIEKFREESTDVLLDLYLSTQGFSSRFRVAFLRVHRPGIGRKSDLLVIHFARRLDLRQLADIEDAINEVYRAAFRLYVRDDKFLSYIERNKIVEVDKLSHPGSVEIFLALTPAFIGFLGAFIVGKIVDRVWDRIAERTGIYEAIDKATDAVLDKILGKRKNKENANEKIYAKELEASEANSSVLDNRADIPTNSITITSIEGEFLTVGEQDKRLREAIERISDNDIDARIRRLSLPTDQFNSEDEDRYQRAMERLSTTLEDFIPANKNENYVVAKNRKFIVGREKQIPTVETE